MGNDVKSLPQLGNKMFLTDGGLETTLIFLDGLELPEFAAFVLLKDPAGRETLRRYYDSYASLASRFDAGMVLETPTWRSSSDWGQVLGYSANDLRAANQDAVRLMNEVRSAHSDDIADVVVSGCIGPRGDGYQPGRTMSALDAMKYHAEQIQVFADSGVDMVTAITMNNIDEAEGIVRAAEASNVPVAISFTVETDGALPAGQGLGEAIKTLDAVTLEYPSYYMINCAHPSHFSAVLDDEAPWINRIGGLRANSSMMSHAELDVAPELDEGDPVQLGAEHAELKRKLSGLTVLGGCCGTDLRHVEQIAASCAGLFA